MKPYKIFNTKFDNYQEIRDKLRRQDEVGAPFSGPQSMALNSFGVLRLQGRVGVSALDDYWI
jgi:hypothetical protein